MEWFYAYSFLDDPGPPGNFPHDADWNFFVDHVDTCGIIRDTDDYEDWYDWGEDQVSRPQRFKYELHGKRMYQEYQKHFVQ